MASEARHGSATPSPSASTPQRSHVEGMNCIQPIAPAELGPMLRPKFDSTLLIAASTCHGMPYAAPASRQSALSSAYESCSGRAGGVPSDAGRTIDPGRFGTCALGSVAGAVTSENVLAEAAPVHASRSPAAR